MKKGEHLRHWRLDSKKVGEERALQNLGAIG